MATARKSFESILLDKSWISQQDLDRARQRKKPGQELTDVLVEMGALEPQRLARALAQEYRLPFETHIDEKALDLSLLRKVPINYAKKNRLLPMAIHQGELTIAIADPSNYEPIDDLHVMFAMPVNSIVVPGQVVDDAINRAYDQAATTTAQDLMIDLETIGASMRSRAKSPMRPATCSNPMTPPRSSSWSMASCRRRSRTAPAIFISNASRMTWWSGSGLTACSTTSFRRPSASSPRSSHASRLCRG